MCFRFCMSLRKCALETLGMIRQAAHVCSNGMLCTSVEGDHDTDRPVGSTTADTVARLQQPVHEDRQQTIEGFFQI
jgi:hypothetical protein